MIGGHRTAGLALLGACVAAWLIVPGQMTARSRSLDVQFVQEIQPIAPGEPPLADGGAPAVPGSTVVVDPAAPAVTIRVRVPASATAGQPLTYRILVDNISRSKAHRVVVRASVPTNVGPLDLEKITPKADPLKPDAKEAELYWTLGTMEGGASKEISLVVVPDGKGEVKLTARVSFEHGQSVVTRLNQPSLQVKLNGPTEAVLKTPTKYTLDVTNNGAADAEAVEVVVALPEGLTFSDSNPPNSGNTPLRWNIPKLELGKTQRIEYTVIPEVAGTLKTTATVAGKGLAAQTATSQVVAGQHQLVISMTGPPLGVKGLPLVYTITVANKGAVTARNVVLLNPVPQERDEKTGQLMVEFVNATGGGQYTPPTVGWSLGNLPPGGTQRVQMTLRANGYGRLKNVAEIRADQALADKALALTILVDPNRRLLLDIDKSHEKPQVGDTVVYVVRVINPSNDPIAGIALGVSMTDNVSLVDFSNGATKGQQAGLKPTVQFDPLPPIPSGQIREYYIKVKVDKPGEVKLTATATANPSLPGFPMESIDPPPPRK